MYLSLQMKFNSFSFMTENEFIAYHSNFNEETSRGKEYIKYVTVTFEFLRLYSLCPLQVCMEYKQNEMNKKKPNDFKI